MQDTAIQIQKIEPGRLTPALQAQIDAIFFGAAARTYPPGPEREGFRERWLGRYLGGGSDALFLAIEGTTVAGYLVGAIEDPALQDRFADITYFRTDFSELCRQFPAHLHINLAPAFRSHGIGARLIEAFADYAARHGAAGMHIVTGAGMRNVRFYERCGFQQRGAAERNGGEVVFLGRALQPRPAQGSASIAR
ncbi:MAG: GNAT family N-acetyltransferase [Hyphomicrobiaceae bacterium]|jgi:GNAT superfamily N-acetyltransferase